MTDTKFLKSDYFKLLTKKEELCEELKMYHSIGDLFNSVRHPLVYSVPHIPDINALLNRQLIEKKKQIKFSLQNKDYEGYVFIHEKPHRLNAFVEIMDKLSDKQYWKILAEVWINSENNWQNLAEWKKLLKSKRRHQDYFMDADERKLYNELPDIVTVYRGYTPNKNIHGISFSLSKAKATWFSKRFGKDGKVLTLQVKKENIFAFLDGRNEKEVIIINR